MSKRVAVYARVSTLRQAENDISIPDQLAQAERYCQQRGWSKLAEFIDAGASARDDKRPQLQALMDAACVDPSPFDVVLVHSQSRFFRDPVGYGIYKSRLSKHGVTLASITQDFGVGPAADFAETIVAAADAYNSAENAKHVTRTMLENARQGFWNGAPPPFGYRTVEAEKRGQRSKKRLEIDTKQAEVVRLMFKLFLEGDGTSGPLGVKAITQWLNARGFRNARGNPFYLSNVHTILSRETYSGVHHYNCIDSRTGRARPREEWVAVPVPPIVSAGDFQRVQALLEKRRPDMTPPRISSSDVLLTGLARCDSCGGPMMVRTGKGGRYRYYACAGHRLKGSAACPAPVAVPEAQLDGMVMGALADQLLTPERLPVLLREANRHCKALASGNLQRRSQLRKQIAEQERRIRNLYNAVADGTVTSDALFKEALSEAQRQRSEAIRLLSLLDVEAPPVRQALSNAQAGAIAAKLKRSLLEAPPSLRRRYVRGLVADIVVDREKAIVSGPKAALATVIAAQAYPAGEVRSFVREWRTRKDSNL